MFVSEFNAALKKKKFRSYQSIAAYCESNVSGHFNFFKPMNTGMMLTKHV